MAEVEHTLTPFGVPVAQVAMVEHRTFDGRGLFLGVGFLGLVLGGMLALARLNWWH